MNAAAAAAGAGGAAAAGAVGAVATATPALNVFDLWPSFVSNIGKNLHDLFELVTATVTKYRETPNYANYLRHCSNIFEDKTVSIESFNIKGLQSSILFRMMLEENGRKSRDSDQATIVSFLEALKDESKRDAKWTGAWDKYDEIRHFIMSKKFVIYNFNLLDLCDPRQKVLVSLAGELSFDILNRSLAQQIYLIGLATENMPVDGKEMDPLTFFIHDLAHKIDCENFIGTSEATRANTNRFLIMREFDGRPWTAEETYACDIWIFIITHEPVLENQERIFLSGPITEDNKIDKVLIKRFGIYDHFIDFFSKRCLYTFYSGLLPERYRLPAGAPKPYGAAAEPLLAAIKAYLVSSFGTFLIVWNSSFPRRERKPAGFYAERRTKKQSRKQKRRQSRKTRRSLS